METLWLFWLIVSGLVTCGGLVGLGHMVTTNKTFWFVPVLGLTIFFGIAFLILMLNGLGIAP